MFVIAAGIPKYHYQSSSNHPSFHKRGVIFHKNHSIAKESSHLSLLSHPYIYTYHRWCSYFSYIFFHQLTCIMKHFRRLSLSFFEVSHSHSTLVSSLYITSHIVNICCRQQQQWKLLTL